MKEETIESDNNKAAPAQEAPESTERKSGNKPGPPRRAVLTALIISLICSASAVAVYDRFFAQKVVTANIAKFVLDQRDLYFEGKIDRQQYVNNLTGFIALVKSQPRNRIVILEDVVAANAEKLEPR